LAKVKIILEVRSINPADPSGEEVLQQTIAAQPEQVIAALRQLDGDSIASLVLEQQQHRLFVGGGPERFNVLAQLGYDDFYNLVSDPSLRGFDELVIGNQLTPVPRRHLVTLENARDAVLEFLGTWHHSAITTLGTPRRVP
jgi:hypothetical protein